MADQTPVIIWVKWMITILYLSDFILKYPYKTAKSLLLNNVILKLYCIKIKCGFFNNKIFYI